MSAEQAIPLVEEALIRRISELEFSGRRRVIALAGPPASGKSFLAERLETQIKASTVLPMDGFHLDNRILRKRGLLDRKGAPETFDCAGFVHMVRRLKTDAEIIFPVFDRARDIAIAGAGCIDATCRTVIVEGNYLLFDHPGWAELDAYWDLRVFLDPPDSTLRERLVQRWLAHGLTREQALGRVMQNDLPNAHSIHNGLTRPDIRYNS